MTAATRRFHQNHCQHGWERFLPWHRAYLYEFEQNLQDFVKDIMVPYWDWTMPQYRPHEPENGWIIPKAFQAMLFSNRHFKVKHSGN
jgi:tyrosinase